MNLYIKFKLVMVGLGLVIIYGAAFVGLMEIVRGINP